MSDVKAQQNARVQSRYDELMTEGRHGHYETMFRVVREEATSAVLAERAKLAGPVDALQQIVAYASRDGDLIAQHLGAIARAALEKVAA